MWRGTVYDCTCKSRQHFTLQLDYTDYAQPLICCNSQSTKLDLGILHHLSYPENHKGLQINTDSNSTLAKVKKDRAASILLQALTWWTQILHLSQNTISFPSSLSGERHTSQMTSSSYSIPRPSSVSIAWFIFSWQCRSSTSIVFSIVFSSRGPHPTVQNREKGNRRHSDASDQVWEAEKQDNF